MATTIYYFSGTGNSLDIARRLAGQIPDSQVRNIAEDLGRINKNSGTEHEEWKRKVVTESIGFVFPTYAYGLPRIVKEFAESVFLPEESYIFAVASCAGIPGTVLKQFDKVLKKRKSRLNAGFAVLDPSSSLISDPEKDGIQRLMISASRGEKPELSSDRVPEIAAVVAAGKNHPIETSNRKTNFFGSILYPLAMKNFPSLEGEFRVTEACSGCGICAKVCPRENIDMEPGKPQWGENCEMCHACIQWCPNSAVQYKDLTENRPRYRNPNVSVKDMVLRAGEV